MKTKPLPIQEVKDFYTNEFYSVLESNIGYKYERLTECLLFTLQAKTGLRISDILELKYSNLIDKGLETYLELVLKKTKNTLTLPIDRIMLKMLQDYKEYCNLVFNVATSGNSSQERIFYNYKSNNGKIFSYMWCNKRINKLNNSGVLGKVYDNVGTHSIRKGLAEYLYTKKGLRTTQYLLGHKSMLTTEIYLELDKEQHLKDIKEALSI
ncbi:MULTISPECIES: tyrosine-type recombinase/integrase [Flavobacterium]|uniref:Tyrosine-type recombinase/integrase n=1 Tax=Flavobacterium keumense TaxID=1306518 RepID=A0ABY8N3M5_9FLAO|nr:MULTISPECIES: tyrosine-type recombinase/integrase [Flavobacterium]WGK94262.1 tyrosine-type recombinase/integrase [Flavobacterium keumense]